MNAQCTSPDRAAIPVAEPKEQKKSDLLYQAATIGVILLFLISFL